MNFNEKLDVLRNIHKNIVSAKNSPVKGGGIWQRYALPVLTEGHAPLFWRYDLDPARNPFLNERFGINGVFNAGAIRFKGEYVLVARVEASDRKSFFAVARSKNGTDGFRFDKFPITLRGEESTNVYDMRLTAHEDGWIYGVYCAENKDPQAADGDLSSAVACAGIVRTKDLEHWEVLPHIKAPTQQRNVALHPEFVGGKYAFYTRPQEGFIMAGASGSGIGWALMDDITRAEIKDEKIIDFRHYHTIKETKNGEGPAPIRTAKGWLHLAHGVRECAAGMRYVLYMYMTSLEDPSKVIAEPAGYVLAPQGEERVGDVSNVLFCNGWVVGDDDRVYLYYASSDTRMHVATASLDALVDYCLNTPADGYASGRTVERLTRLIESNNGLTTDDDL